MVYYYIINITMVYSNILNLSKFKLSNALSSTYIFVEIESAT